MEKTLSETLIFKYVYFDTVIDVTVKKREQNKLEREFTSHCPYRRSFESANLTIFVQSEHDERIIPPRMMKYAKFLTSEHEIITQLQKLDWKLYGRCTHSYKRKTNIFYTMQGVKFSVCHGGCTICLDNNASEAEAITDPKESRKVNH